MPDKVLITGGAGYIGSHTTRMMVDLGYDVLVLDNLINGHRDSLEEGPHMEFFEGDISDAALLDDIFSKHSISAVLHFAAFAYVGESVRDPAKYYKNNVANPLVLLDVMCRHGCTRFILSSTCATYGNPEYLPIDEGHPQNPINPYGRSKRMLERILEDYDNAYGIRHVQLRYFNACGASEDARIGEDHNPETHLIPLVLQTLTGERKNITIFGDDYDTPDGTCVRDYIHIMDLARAHVLALKKIEGGHPSFACNLGTGKGVSVKEIISVAEKITGKTVPVVIGRRRDGDPAILVANPTKAKELLGWTAEHCDVADSIRSAWKWMQSSHGGHFALH